jgi:hypothetical protein
MTRCQPPPVRARRFAWPATTEVTSLVTTALRGRKPGKTSPMASWCRSREYRGASVQLWIISATPTPTTASVGREPRLIRARRLSWLSPAQAHSSVRHWTIGATCSAIGLANGALSIPWTPTCTQCRYPARPPSFACLSTASGKTSHGTGTPGPARLLSTFVVPQARCPALRLICASWRTLAET